MTDQQPQPYQAQPPADMWRDDEIDLLELIQVLWSHKWKIMGCGFGGAFLAAAFSVLFMQNVYQSSVLLAPADGQSGGLSGMLSQYSGLASLAGVSLPGGEGANKSQLAQAVLQSREFIGQFVERHDILVPLMAAKKWNASTGELVIDKRDYDTTTQTWVRNVHSPYQPKPSRLEAHEEFIDILSVNEDAETGFVTVSVKHYSPILAAQWADLLVEDVNRTMRERDIVEAQRSIEFLRQQIQKTALADMEGVFYDLIQAQTETIMLAETRPEYAFRVVDPAVVPEEKVSPYRSLLAALGGLIGGLGGLFWVFIVKAFARLNHE